MDTRLDDLQSEIEAGARTVEKIQDDVGRVDAYLKIRFRQPTLMGSLIPRIRELRERVAHQRTALKDLRGEFQALRKQTDK